MTSLIDGADQINALRYLYLTEISEPTDNVLRLVVTEGRSGALSREDAKELEGISPSFSTIGSIGINDASAVFEITFESYVTYAVTNESFTVAEPEDHYTGRLLRTYSRSRFLDFVAASTIDYEGYRSPYAHYCVACLNHIIDVASENPPAIRRLR